MANKRQLLTIGTAIILTIFIAAWIIDIKQGNLPYFDQWNRAFVPLFADTPIYTFFRYITVLGSKTFVLPMTIIMTVILWIWYKDFRPAFVFGPGTLCAHLINTFIKELIQRERPSISVLLDAEGYSFPSGHAMVSIVCYGLLAYLIGLKCRTIAYRKMVHSLFLLLVLLIGISRYVINVHFLTDIVTEYFIGWIILIILIQLYAKMKKISILP